ncbi:hypothetical protein [Halalkalicoccus tibetensis]|uniref:S-layer protein n=1 Tax=Halalkalicoccus tibetensis TaxID=175632 RepID=A0ABD5V1Y2_9EURY
MNDRRYSRRRVVLAAGSAALVGLAGCADDENGDDEEENGENGDDDGDDIDLDEGDDAPELTISLENEDGEPVSTGVEISVEELDGVTTHNISEETLEDGEASPESELEPGDYLITVESLEEEFEPQEEEVTLEEGEEEEVTFTLEGATADEDADVDEEEAEEEDEG